MSKVPLHSDAGTKPSTLAIKPSTLATKPSTLAQAAAYEAKAALLAGQLTAANRRCFFVEFGR